MKTLDVVMPAKSRAYADFLVQAAKMANNLDLLPDGTFQFSESAVGYRQWLNVECSATGIRIGGLTGLKKDARTTELRQATIREEGTQHILEIDADWDSPAIPHEFIIDDDRNGAWNLTVRPQGPDGLSMEQVLTLIERILESAGIPCDRKDGAWTWKNGIDRISFTTEEAVKTDAPFGHHTTVDLAGATITLTSLWYRCIRLVVQRESRWIGLAMGPEDGENPDLPQP